MKLSSTMRWINQRCVSIVMAGLLIGLCVLFHYLPLMKMVMLGDPKLIGRNKSQAELSMVLIDFINKKPSLAAIYLVLFIGTLLFMALRKSPGWATVCCWVIFAVPCILYLAACSNVSAIHVQVVQSF